MSWRNWLWHATLSRFKLVTAEDDIGKSAKTWNSNKAQEEDDPAFAEKINSNGKVFFNSIVNVPIYSIVSRSIFIVIIANMFELNTSDTVIF